jgi:hypothetical protein
MAFDPAVLDSDTLTNKQTKNGATRMLHDQDRRDTNRLGRRSASTCRRSPL